MRFFVVFQNFCAVCFTVVMIFGEDSQNEIFFWGCRPHIHSQPRLGVHFFVATVSLVVFQKNVDKTQEGEKGWAFLPMNCNQIKKQKQQHCMCGDKMCASMPAKCDCGMTTLLLGTFCGSNGQLRLLPLHWF